MTCTFAQYCRIETIAGGISASRRAIIKAAHTRLSESGKSPAYREARHAWLRSVLKRHERARRMAR